VENRGKSVPLADHLYVSPYLLRPLRRLEEVEDEAKQRAKRKVRSGKPANDLHAGQAPASPSDK